MRKRQRYADIEGDFSNGPIGDLVAMVASTMLVGPGCLAVAVAIAVIVTLIVL